jgi:hypothetical protein
MIGKSKTLRGMLEREDQFFEPHISVSTSFLCLVVTFLVHGERASTVIY